MSGNISIQPSLTLYATPEDVRHMTKAAIKVLEDTRLQRLIDDLV